MDQFLTFFELRQQNIDRCERVFKHPLKDWSVAEWGNATAGECGEACNVAKKLIRHRDAHHNITESIPVETLRQMLADEIADMVIYADLWAASEGINLAVAIRDKFNRDSDKRGSDIKLGA